LIESLADKDDIIAVRYWSKKEFILFLIIKSLCFSESIKSTVLYITQLGKWELFLDSRNKINRESRLLVGADAITE
jgi:hypothetical protein